MKNPYIFAYALMLLTTACNSSGSSSPGIPEEYINTIASTLPDTFGTLGSLDSISYAGDANTLYLAAAVTDTLTVLDSNDLKQQIILALAARPGLVDTISAAGATVVCRCRMSEAVSPSVVTVTIRPDALYSSLMAADAERSRAISHMASQIERENSVCPDTIQPGVTLESARIDPDSARVEYTYLFDPSQFPHLADVDVQRERTLNFLPMLAGQSMRTTVEQCVHAGYGIRFLYTDGRDTAIPIDFTCAELKSLL